MLYEWTEEYLLRLQEQKSLPLVERNLVDSGDTKRYSLCDHFHLKSKTKSPAIAFRDVRNTDLSINTSVCEQQNAEMAKDRFEIYAIFSLQLCHFFYLLLYFTGILSVEWGSLTFCSSADFLCICTMRTEMRHF